MKRILLFAILIGGAVAANAQVTNYTNATTWDAAVDYYQSIGFTSLGSGTQLTNQYAGAGVIFDGTTYTIQDAAFTDGYGIDYNGGATGPITIQFSNYVTAFATDFPGGNQFALYAGNNLVGTSNQFGGSGVGFFGGVISGVAFNKVLITDFVDNRVYIDNIHYGAGTPTPEPMSMLALGIGVTGLLIRHRRK